LQKPKAGSPVKYAIYSTVSSVCKANSELAISSKSAALSGEALACSASATNEEILWFGL
jgi:hypothetical protein